VLQPILLHLKKPSLSFKLNTSKRTKITIELLGKNKKLLASWHKTTGKGTTDFRLLLPPKARHTGKDKLELLYAGLKNPETYAVTLKP
jgi:hypothetical protein